MASYGFLLYGPGSYTWYQYLDRCMPNRTVENLLLKVYPLLVRCGSFLKLVLFRHSILKADLPSEFFADFIKPDCAWPNRNCCGFCME